MSDSEKRMADPSVKNAIRVLVGKGVTIPQIESAYRYYDSLKRNHESLKGVKS